MLHKNSQVTRLLIYVFQCCIYRDNQLFYIKGLANNGFWTIKIKRTKKAFPCPCWPHGKPCEMHWADHQDVALIGAPDMWLVWREMYSSSHDPTARGWTSPSMCVILICKPFMNTTMINVPSEKDPSKFCAVCPICEIRSVKKVAISLDLEVALPA